MVGIGERLNVGDLSGVIAYLRLLQGLLTTQERGTLRKKHRKSRQDHGRELMRAVLPGAPIRQLSGDGAEPLEKVIETASVHTPTESQ